MFSISLAYNSLKILRFKRSYKIAYLWINSSWSCQTFFTKYHPSSFENRKIIMPFRRLFQNNEWKNKNWWFSKHKWWIQLGYITQTIPTDDAVPTFNNLEIENEREREREKSGYGARKATGLGGGVEGGVARRRATRIEMFM